MIALVLIVALAVAVVVLYRRNASRIDSIDNEQSAGQDWRDADDPDRRTLP